MLCTLALVVLVSLVHTGQADIGETITGWVTCDNRMWFYADGRQIAYSTNWQVADHVSLPASTRTVAFMCVDFGVIAGIKAYFSNGVRTDHSWKCSTINSEGWNKVGYDDSHWHSATVAHHRAWGNKPAQLHGKAEWIWTSGWHGQDRVVYCRREFRPAICDKPPITGYVTCDNDMQFYADGQLITSSGNWKVANHVSLPSCTRTVAFMCVDFGVIGGIKAFFSNGVRTDHSWKCSTTIRRGWNEAGYDDSHWRSATIARHGAWANLPRVLHGKAEWIWTAGWKGRDRVVYCRREF